MYVPGQSPATRPPERCALSPSLSFGAFYARAGAL